MSDLRLAFRSIVRNPGFSGVVVLTLALGIGANTALFSIFDHALLRRLPVPNPEQLVNLSSPGPKTGSTSANSGFGGRAEVFSYALFRDLEQVQDVFTGVAAHRDLTANVAFKGQASSVNGLLVSGSYFPVLGIPPAMGRLLSEADDRSIGTHPVIVLSYDYWRTIFDADATVINDTLVVNGQSMTIIGVAPESFVSTTLDHKPKFFVPLSMAGLVRPDWNGFTDRLDHWLYVLARLKPGIVPDAAERTLNIPFTRLINEVELPAQRGGLSESARQAFRARRIELEPGDKGQRPDRDAVARLALLLFCVTTSVLLMACANVANLLLARGVHRGPEMALRLSLGAGRGQLVRHLLVEAMALSMLGGGAGVVLASWTLGIASPLLPGADTFQFELNPILLAFTLILAIGTVMLTGVYPALYSTRPDLTVAIKGRASAPGPSGATRFRNTLTATQVALSITLLVLAGLFTRSMLNVGQLELGIQPERLMTFRISPELSGYSRERARLLVERTEQELTTVPGVVSVATSTIPLLDGFGWSSNITVERRDGDRDAHTADVGPGYFRTVGIPLVDGREFTAADTPTSPKVAIVNESLVREFNLGQDVIGRRVGLGAGNIMIDIEIVGVARDARYLDVTTPPSAQFYLPYRQIQRFAAVNFYLKVSGAPDAMLANVAQTMRRIDPTIPVENLRTMDQQVRAATEEQRSLTTLSAALAMLAVMLAAVGLYGVLSYSVAQRRREIGVRMALGATTSRIVQVIFGHVAGLTAAGGVVGLVAALALGRLAESMLFGVSGPDPAVLAVASLVTTGVAVAAAVLPARRAARVDPMTALRSE